MIAPIGCTERPDVPVTRDIAPSSREPAPPLETAHWLRGAWIDAITIGTLLIVRLLQQERRFNRAMSIRAATMGVHIAGPGVRAVERHAAPEGRLIGGDHPRVSTPR